MVTADTAVPFCPDFFPAILYGGKPLVAVYSIVEEYEITGNVLLLRTFASQQIPEKSFVRMYYIHILWCLKIFNSVHNHKFSC